MKNQQCPICKSENEKKQLLAKEMLLGTRDVFNYSLCKECGCAYFNDNLDDFSKYYPNDYHVFSANQLPFRKRYALKKVAEYNFYKKGLIGKFVGLVFKIIYGHIPETNIGWIGDAYKILGGKKKNLKIIDIGCGKGVLLHQLKDLGFTNLSGVEPYADNKNSTIPIVKQSVETFLNQKNNGKYDIVIMSHVLEHLFDHEDILKGLKKLLNDNGILIIAMPILGKSFKKYGTDRYSFDAPRHVIIHSDNSFEILVKKTGLHISNKIYEEIPYNLFASELYSWDISSKEIQNFSMKIFDKNKYKTIAKYIEYTKFGGASVVYFINNK